MAISIKFFASLREKMGKDETSIDCQGDLSVADIWSKIIASEGLDSEDLAADNLLCSINLEYAKWDSIVKDGDEVAFFPKVTGG